MRIHRVVFLLPALFLVACRSTHLPEKPESDGRSFIILQLNDVYEISPLDRGRVGGMARVATVLRRLEAENPNTIAVLAGDFVSPSLISSLRRNVDGRDVPIAGEQMVAAMNAVGIDYVTFGNHEFDIPEASLQKRLNESEFTYVSANVRHHTPAGDAPFVQEGRGPVGDYAVHTFQTPDGTVRLGMIGLTLPFNRASYVSYQDVYEAAERAFQEANDGNDVVFALTHLSLGEDIRLAGTVPGMLLILGGHEHEATLATAGTTHITKADANARTVFIHRIHFDPATRRVDVDSELMPITDAVPEEPATARVVARWEQMADSLIRAMGYEPHEVVATFDTLYDGREASIRNFPTNLGRLVASAMRHADPAADLALINSGSIRVDDQLIGAVEQRDILRTLPFGGPVVHARLPGGMLARILDVGLHENRSTGGYLQTSPNVAEVAGSYTIDREPLDPARTYEVVLPDFLSKGRETGLGFLGEDPSLYRPPSLTGVGGAERNDLRDIVISYLKSTSPGR